MKFVQHKEDVIWKEGRMCIRGKPFEVEDEYALGVFSTDPQFEKFQEKPHEEEVKETAPPTVLKGYACPKCGRRLGKGGHFHIKACKG